MSFLGEVLREALRVLGDFGPELRDVLWLTLLISGVATLVGVALGIPFGMWLGLGASPCRHRQALPSHGFGLPALW